MRRLKREREDEAPPRGRGPAADGANKAAKTSVDEAPASAPAWVGWGIMTSMAAAAGLNFG